MEKKKTNFAWKRKKQILHGKEKHKYCMEKKNKYCMEKKRKQQHKINNSVLFNT